MSVAILVSLDLLDLDLLDARDVLNLLDEHGNLYLAVYVMKWIYLMKGYLWFWRVGNIQFKIIFWEATRRAIYT